MKTRIIHTKMWRDGYFGGLSPHEQNIFMYLLTNENVNIIHLYELTPKQIAYDTNLDLSEVSEILQKFENDQKIERCKDYIFLVNSDKYETYRGYKSAYEKIAILSKMCDESLRNYGDEVTRILEGINEEIDKENPKHAKILGMYNKMSKRFDALGKAPKKPNGPSVPDEPQDEPVESAEVSVQVYTDLTPAQQMRAFVGNVACSFEDKTVSVQDAVRGWLMSGWSVSLEEANIELNKFIAYWTEPTKSGKAVRWEKQQTFEVKRRLVTWMGNRDYVKKTGSANKHKAGTV